MGLLLAREIHEVAFFSLGTETEQQKRSVLEKFIDEVGRERTNMV